MKALFSSALLAGSLLLTACNTPTGNGDAAMPSFEQLSGEPWQVATLNSKPVGNATVTMVFPEAGKLAGKAACNNYMASYSDDGEQFTIQTGALTRKACMAPLMELEKQFMDALKGVDTAVLNDLGELVLSGEGVEIKATR
ncbi:META domain-containing protein [Alcanivorax sp. S6407]|uniref:META domain-containing protein n=1 Tax=Alcanivorax sp. S6407 TaxID=2926424 RepID=UPI001FF2371E|nr:META domain-containing protein [Alcanivorax sp. S6407]MCK0154264.1 META domain-containing protein [Alcanivorax sp. S6407]